MSALPGMSFRAPHGLSTREAAAALHVSETTLRRALNRAREESHSAAFVNGELRGVPFLAWRDTALPRAPWRFAFDIEFSALTPDEYHLDRASTRDTDDRIRSLRAVIQERDELDRGTVRDPDDEPEVRPARGWWRFWR
jgi:hypothetical protein